jgi:hypothetical protein
MTAPAGRQAERRTAGGGVAQPLNLIHRNNCSNPMPMRVSGRLTLENITPDSLDSWLDFLDFLAGPVGGLLLKRRAAHGAK